MENPFSLDGRASLVTGAGPNIGCGIGMALAQAGASVACVDLDKSRAEIVVSEVTELGGRATAFECDVTDPEQVTATVAAAEEWSGQPIDILVNTAGTQTQTGLLNSSLDQWHRVLRVNLDGSFLCSQAVAKRLVETGKPGSIIVILSSAAYQGEPGNVAYSTTKAGLINFARSAAIELAPYNIRVNGIAPTATDLTELIDRSKKYGLPLRDGIETVLESARQQVPLQRLPGPAAYGAAAVYLSSDAGAFVTGFDLRVDAGTIAKYWRDVSKQAEAFGRVPEGS